MARVKGHDATIIYKFLHAHVFVRARARLCVCVYPCDLTLQTGIELFMLN